MIVRTTSHRSRRKLKTLVGETQEFFSWQREGSWSEIPDEHAEAALAITGITEARKTDDLERCIDFNGGLRR